MGKRSVPATSPLYTPAMDVPQHHCTLQALRRKDSSWTRRDWATSSIPTTSSREHTPSSSPLSTQQGRLHQTPLRVNNSKTILDSGSAVISGRGSVDKTIETSEIPPGYSCQEKAQQNSHCLNSSISSYPTNSSKRERAKMEEATKEIIILLAWHDCQDPSWNRLKFE